MRIMIASDIHGSAYYCRKMIEAYKEEKAEKLLLLGDVLYHGPRNDLPKEYNPKAVIEMLNAESSEILCVRGNCEAEVDQMVLDFPVLAEYCIFYVGNRMMFVAHGHNFNPDNLPPMKKGDILLNGHTHVPKCVEYKNGSSKEYVYMNPGSISIPKENSSCGYMILDGCRFTWKDLERNSYMDYVVCMEG